MFSEREKRKWSRQYENFNFFNVIGCFFCTLESDLQSIRLLSYHNLHGMGQISRDYCKKIREGKCMGSKQCYCIAKC